MWCVNTRSRRDGSPTDTVEEVAFVTVTLKLFGHRRVKLEKKGDSDIYFLSLALALMVHNKQRFVTEKMSRQSHTPPHFKSITKKGTRSLTFTSPPTPFSQVSWMSHLISLLLHPPWHLFLWRDTLPRRRPEGWNIGSFMIFLRLQSRNKTFYQVMCVHWFGSDSWECFLFISLWM